LNNFPKKQKQQSLTSFFCYYTGSCYPFPESSITWGMWANERLQKVWQIGCSRCRLHGRC